MLGVTFVQGLLAFLFCFVCVLLILLILIQRGRGGGLSGAFGGVGSYSPFGTKTGDALTWATVALTAMYLLIAVVANYFFVPQELTGIVGPSTPAAPVQGGQPADLPDSAQPAPSPAQQQTGSATGSGVPAEKASPAGQPAPSPAPADEGASQSPASQGSD